MVIVVRTDLEYARIFSCRGGADVPGWLILGCITENLVMLTLCEFERRSTGEELFEK